MLGAKILEVRPRGEGQLAGTIPMERTTSPYQLPDAIGDLATTISGLNTRQLSDSLGTLAKTFANTPPDLKRAIEGVARFSQTLDARDAQLRKLLDQRQQVDHACWPSAADQIVGLIGDTNALLARCATRAMRWMQISGNISSMATQLRDSSPTTGRSSSPHWTSSTTC